MDGQTHLAIPVAMAAQAVAVQHLVFPTAQAEQELQMRVLVAELENQGGQVAVAVAALEV